LASTDDLGLEQLGITADDLESLPSGARQHLRDLAKDNRQLREQQEATKTELASFRHRTAAEKAIAEAAVEGVTVEDLKDVPAEQLTATIVKVKAVEKEDARKAAVAAQATALGFENVADYEAAMNRVKAEQETRSKTQAAQAAVVGATPAASTGAEGKSPQEIAREAADKVWKETGSKEQAQMAFVRTLEESEQASIESANAVG
jgi:hypothetical protein